MCHFIVLYFGGDSSPLKFASKLQRLQFRDYHAVFKSAMCDPLWQRIDWKFLQALERPPCSLIELLSTSCFCLGSRDCGCICRTFIVLEKEELGSQRMQWICRPDARSLVSSMEYFLALNVANDRYLVAPCRTKLFYLISEGHLLDGANGKLNS